MNKLTGVEPQNLDEISEELVALASVSEDNRRKHWNLLVDAKKNPVLVREAMLTGVFEDAAAHMIFLDATMKKDVPHAKYAHAAVRLLAETLDRLIPDLEIKSDYDIHLTYLQELRSTFLRTDKALVSKVHSDAPLPTMTVAQLREKLDAFTKEEILNNRTTVLIGATVSTELLNCPDFLDFFAPSDEQQPILLGRIGRIGTASGAYVHVITDAFRIEEDSCLHPNSIYICHGCEANIRVRHKGFWASIVYDVNGPVTGITEYEYIA